MAYLPDLGGLLTSGARFHRAGVSYVIEGQGVGVVTLPSGRIVGCDPLVGAGDTPPFTVPVPPGEYRLHAWVAMIEPDEGSPDRRTAALQLVVAEEAAVRWEPALVEGQEAGELGEDEFFGYPVDAGVGTLADAVALQAMAAWDYDELEKAFIPAQIGPAPAAIESVTDSGTGANVILVDSGWGDGAYPTFIGYAADGRVTSFVTDFMVVPDPSVPA